MKAAVLEDVQQLRICQVPDPQPGPQDVVLRVQAVGVCATDFHLFLGLSHYMFDAKGRRIPLTEHPLILGHEFTGEVVEIGAEVRDLAPGDRVVCDQGLNCRSQGRWPVCSYCASGDSHQCLYYQERGITGLPGGMAEFISMPAVNCLRVPEETSPEQAALVEPLGCVLHSCAKVEGARARFAFGSAEPIRNVLICGAGPAGLLFLQYLRKVKDFDGFVLVSDIRDSSLEFVKTFGGVPLNVKREDPVAMVEELTDGERIDLLIEACGSADVFEQIPKVLKKQGTVLIYGNGHKGGDFGLLSNILFLEPTLIAAVGASGGFDPDGRPQTHRRALELISSGRIQVSPIITHRYGALEEIHHAFEEDRRREDYVKGVLKLV